MGLKGPFLLYLATIAVWQTESGISPFYEYQITKISDLQGKNMNWDI